MSAIADAGAPVLALALVVALLAWYLSYSAARLDRLHQRVLATSAGLEAQLVRRATAAGDLAAAGLLDPATSMLVASAAAEAVAAGEQDPGTGAEGLAGFSEAREQAENDLSRALRVALVPEAVAAAAEDPFGRDVLSGLAAAVQRARLARRFHNDAVTQARRVRRKRVVRWARLAGRAPEPRTVELDDDPPAALAR